jgi:hypothetical protein
MKSLIKNILRFLLFGRRRECVQGIGIQYKRDKTISRSLKGFCVYIS